MSFMINRNMVYLFVVMAFLIGLASCRNPKLPATPRSVSADQIRATIRALPRDSHFSLSGLAFFKGRLYVSTNVGLLVFGGEKAEKLYKWVKEDDVVEGPWIDLANDVLWVQHAHDNSLFKFDGTVWKRVTLPVPAVGYYTRGDILAGFTGISGLTAFWLIGGGHVWRYDAKGTSWIPELEPPAPQYSAIRAVAPSSNSMLYIVREGPSDYAVYNREQNWIKRNLSEKMDFGGIVTNREGTYVRAEDGRLFFIGSGIIEVVKIPGFCEAITRTSTGKILASFIDRGIFLLDNGEWNLQVPYPYGKEEGEHWAFLAESNGQIAYGTSCVPHLKADKITYSGSVALWVQLGKTLDRVSIY
jgi:hypothetical protein